VPCYVSGTGGFAVFDPIEEAERHWMARGLTEGAPGMAVVISTTRAAQIFLGRIDAVLKPFDLTFARCEALALLLFSRAGALPLGKMSVRLQVHPTSVSHAVNRLEDQGLVRRLQHPTDGRTVLAEITPSGRRRATAALAALNAEAFAELGLDDDELQQLFRLLRKVRRAAGDLTESAEV
jgi:DNA-binding MarR family transcriptional regulator